MDRAPSNLSAKRSFLRGLLELKSISAYNRCAMCSGTPTSAAFQVVGRSALTHWQRGPIPVSEPLLQIRNRHTPSCGDPPIVDGACDYVYIGYFENRFGEQWIFEFDRRNGEAWLRGGDIGWNTKVPVKDGVAVNLVLGKDEMQWLSACWVAAQR